MIKSKRVLALGTIAALGFTAAACGSDDDDASSTADTTAGSEAPAGPKPRHGTEAPAVPKPRPTAAHPPRARARSSHSRRSARRTTASQAPDGFRVNLVTDIGKVDDGTFNQFAYEGLTAAVECFGIENTSFIETVSEADYAANIATSLESKPERARHRRVPDHDRHRGGGRSPTPTSTSSASTSSSRSTRPNMAGVPFNEDESGYIAGVLAASLSESGVIGVVAGREDVPPVVKFVNGYTAGAESVNPDIRVLSIYNESFTDAGQGRVRRRPVHRRGRRRHLRRRWPDRFGGVKAAAEAGVWAIGVDQDEYFTTFAGGTAPGSEFLASSAIKRVDLVTFRLIADVGPGHVRRRARRRYGGERPHHVRRAARRRRPGRGVAAVEAARAGLADGSIDDRHLRHRRPVPR